MQPGTLPNTSPAPANFSKSEASVLLDLIRGLAAVAVLIGHGRNLLFVDYNDIPAHRSWFALPYLMTRAGHQAVMVFFVLSGYLIGGSVFRSLKSNQWTWTGYLTHRLTRLYVVVVPGLLSCLLLDWIGMRSGRAAALYGGGLSLMVPNVHLSTNIAAFAGNLAFLQTIRVPTLGSNTALWSLAYEFWYYMLFPLAWLALVNRRTPVPLRLLYLAGVVAVGAFVTPEIRAQFVIWLFGAALALLPVPDFGAKMRVLAAVVYVPLFLMEPIYNPFRGRLPYPEVWPDYILGVLTTIFLWVILSATRTAADNGLARFSRRLSRFSFTLYVVHFPFLVVATTLILGERRWLPTFGHALAGILICGFAMLYAYGLATVTEFRTDRVRKWVERRLHLVRNPKSTPHERVLKSS